MPKTPRVRRHWGAALAVLSALILGVTPAVLSDSAGAEPQRQAPAASPMDVRPADPGPALQSPDPPDTPPAPQLGAPPDGPVPDTGASGTSSQPAETPTPTPSPTATSTIAAGPVAPAARDGSLDRSGGGPLAEPVVPAGWPGWPGWTAPAGGLPPPFGGLLAPLPILPPFPPPLLPPALVVVRAPAPVPPVAAAAAPVVVSLAASVPPLSGLAGVPCASALGATCTAPPLAGLFTVTGSMSYSLSAAGPAGTAVGGVPAIFIPTTAGVERLPCAAVTAQLQTTCTGSTVGNALQGGTVTVRFPLLGGGTADVSGTIVGPGPRSTATPTPTSTATSAVAVTATATTTQTTRTATSTPAAVSTPLAAVPCRELRTLRELAGRLQTVTNPRTGQTVEYLVVGDGARSNQVLVFFNGTSQIIPDWPIQMITNSASSPLIVTTTAYSPEQDSAQSLCRDYRLVFFDYPGVGLSPAATGVTFDQIASDVDAMLADVEQRYRIPTNNVSLIGWSLGTEAALKYSFLSPASNPSSIIHNVILIATKPGGGQSDQTNGNGAQCVQQTFEVLESPSISPALRARLEANNYRLLYPYQGQQPYNGPSSGCTVDINPATDTVTLNVTPGECGPGTQCFRVAADFAENRRAFPWSLTGGVPQNVFVNQRQLTNDFNYSYCSTAGPGFTSTGCSSLPSQPPQLSATNGGVCRTSTPPGQPNLPTSSQCVPLRIQGRITVINGPEDLYIQHTYGAALVAGYLREYGAQKATLVTYPGADGAGHGILLQHPRFVQETIATALQAGGPGAVPPARP